MSAINPKYRQLKAFALVVETGSFKQAADHLAVTQPSFSVLIKELEHDTGVVLFERSTRRCTPTPAGAAFYDQIRGPLAHLEEAYRCIKDVGAGTQGKLSLAALPALSSGVIAHKLAQFQRRFPNVRISLSERKHDQILTAVRQGEVEFGIGSLLRSDPDLSFQPLFKDQLMIVAPPGHPLLKMRPVWKSLDRFDLVLLTGGPAEYGLKVSQVQSSLVVEVEQAATALAMVRNGMGITVLPSTIVPGSNVEGLVCLPIEGRLAERQLGLICKKNTHLSAAARAFIDELGDIVVPKARRGTLNKPPPIRRP
jgi:DNA-binding transcriptional LysR family regulator